MKKQLLLCTVFIITLFAASCSKNKPHEPTNQPLPQPSGYNSNDYEQIKTFLEQSSSFTDTKGNVLTNGQCIAQDYNHTFIPNAPLTWDGVTFDNDPNGKRITEIDFSSHLHLNATGANLAHKVAGDLILKNCTKLVKLNIPDNDLTSLDLTGIAKSYNSAGTIVSKIVLDNNKISTLTLDDSWTKDKAGVTVVLPFSTTQQGGTSPTVTYTTLPKP